VADAVSIRERALTADKSDRLSNASETAAGRLGVWTLLDTGLRVGEPCGLTPRNVLWHQRQLRIEDKSKGLDTNRA
jgi:integrase